MLSIVTRLPGHDFWTVDLGFVDAVSAFAERLFAHQQVAGPYLLGMAIKSKGRLVTLDRAIKALAGTEFRDHLLVLE